MTTWFSRSSGLIKLNRKVKTHLIHIHVLSVKVTTQNRHWNKPDPRANKLIPLPPPLNILIWIYACTRHIIMIYRKIIKIKETNVVSNRALVLLHDLHQHSKRAPVSFFVVVFCYLFLFTNKIYIFFLQIKYFKIFRTYYFCNRLDPPPLL